MTAASEWMANAREWPVPSVHCIAVVRDRLDSSPEASRSERVSAAPGLLGPQLAKARAGWDAWAPGLHGPLSLRPCGELGVQPHEHRGRAVMGPEPEHHLPAMLDQPACPVDQLLHHRLDAPSLGRVAHRCVRPEQSALAHQAQDVHRQRREPAHQRVGVELARGQPGEVQVGLELGVELLVRAVVGAQRDGTAR